MKQQTAMQLMLWYLENEGLENSGAFYKAKHLLELEKEQIVKARIDGDENHTLVGNKRKEYAEQYYNETYKK